MNDNQFQIFPTHYKVPCHTHQCHGRAAFYIGRPDQKHTGTLQLLCEKCANELVESAIALNQAVEVNADPAPIEAPAMELMPFEPDAHEIEVITVDGKAITDMTVKELKAVCKHLGITGYSDKKEKELIAMIEEASNELAIEAIE